jgi:hypothetical protein
MVQELVVEVAGLVAEVDQTSQLHLGYIYWDQTLSMFSKVNRT